MPFLCSLTPWQGPRAVGHQLQCDSSPRLDLPRDWTPGAGQVSSAGSICVSHTLSPVLGLTTQNAGCAQASPRSAGPRRLQLALEGAPSPSARPAPPPRAPPRRRRQVRPGGRGLRLPARSPRARGSGLRGAPPRPAAPSPLRYWTQVGSRARATALAPSAPRRRRRCTGERGGRGGARTAERGPWGAPALGSSRRTAGVGAQPRKVKLQGPGRTATCAPARLAPASPLGSRVSGPPPAACSPVGHPDRGAACVHQLGHRISVGWRPGRSH